MKRDDLIHPLLSGNKYWKLYQLIHSRKEDYKKIISYGGCQSNAMLSIAALCHTKGWEFHYTSKPVAKHVQENPSGNFKAALALGMQLHEVSHADYDACVEQLRKQQVEGSLFVPQGGADPMAEFGVRALVADIRRWQQESGIRCLNIVIPSGTGTMAYYLAKLLPDLSVLTTSVVGDRQYLLCQMEALGALPENLKVLEADKKYHFAKLYPELLLMYQSLKAAGIEFDLLYGALMWKVLLQHSDAIEGAVLYLHSGGLMGNVSMLERYRHQGMF